MHTRAYTKTAQMYASGASRRSTSAGKQPPQRSPKPKRDARSAREEGSPTVGTNKARPHASLA